MANWTNGRVTIRTHRTDGGTFRVETVYAGSAIVIDPWTRAYNTKAECQAAARHAKAAFTAHGDARQIEARRDELVQYIAEVHHRQLRRCGYDRAAYAAAHAELDAMADLDMLDVAARLAADFANRAA